MFHNLHILGKVLSSVHWNHLQCNLNCDSILYLTSRLSSPGRTVYECATKGQILQTGSIKTVSKYKRPELARSRVEQQRRRGSRVLLGHYATNSKAFLVLSSLQSKVYSRGAQLSARSRPFNEHFKLCLLWCSKKSCCKGDRPAAAF